MVGESQEIREFIETRIRSSGSASLVEAMADFAQRHNSVPSLGLFNRALELVPTPLVLVADTHSLKPDELGTSQLELTLAELMSVYDQYTGGFGTPAQSYA
jgi:hypothetical protein